MLSPFISGPFNEASCWFVLGRVVSWIIYPDSLGFNVQQPRPGLQVLPLKLFEDVISTQTYLRHPA